MKKRILLVILILLNILIVFRLFILITQLIFPEKVIIEDVWTYKNRYVGNIVTNKGNIYHIDYSNFDNKNKNLNDSSNYLLSISLKRKEKINNKDFKSIKEKLNFLKKKHIINNKNSKCRFNKYPSNDSLLIYYDYENNKKIIIGGKKICEYWDIIDIVQDYYMYVGDV